MDVEAQRLAVIGSIGALWICLGGAIMIAVVHDAALAGQVVNALVALAGTSTFGATIMHVASQFATAKVQAAQAQATSQVAIASSNPNSAGGTLA